MESVIENIRALLPGFLICWGVFLLSVWRRPQHFRNSVLLMAALGMTMLFVSGLFGRYQPTALLCMALFCGAALLIVPGMLITNGITMLRREGRSFGNLLSLFLGALIGAGELTCVYAAFGIGSLPYEIYRWLLLFSGTVIYFSLWILSFVLYMLSIRWIPRRKRFDYVIIHGCGLIAGERVSKLLSNRLDKAIEIYQKSSAKPILIPSGGKGTDEKLSEAEAMTQYLLTHGVPAEHILPEASSTTTMENLRCSKELIERRGTGRRVALVSSNYHVYRCLLYASRLGLRCTGVGADVAWYYWPSAALREFAAVFTKRPHIFWILAGYALTVLSPALYMFL